VSIKFSIFLPTGFAMEFMGFPDAVAAYERMTEITKAADEAGFDTAWLADHFTPAVPGVPAGVFESWVSLAGLARDTQRIRLGHMVNGNSYRHPSLLAKMASTLDVSSNGRFTLGLGAGWWEPDYAYGFTLGTAGERLQAMREAAQIVKSMWADEQTTFDGKYYQVSGAVNLPKGVQAPQIPLLIAGGGEKVTLKIAAEFADACNIIESPEVLRHKFNVLKQHTDTVGRKYEDVLRTSCSYAAIVETDAEAAAAIPPWAPSVFPGNAADYLLVGTIDTIRERIAAYEDAGVQELAITFGQAIEDPSILHKFAEAFIR
jgi:F420-dependent oxidoreductase-like protein